MADDDELGAAVADLDDSYLKVMLLLSARRAQTEEPRRAAFWHALAVRLADEQEKRQGAMELDRRGAAAGSLTGITADGAELEAVMNELRHEMATLDAELRESVGNLDRADTRPM